MPNLTLLLAMAASASALDVQPEGEGASDPVIALGLEHLEGWNEKPQGVVGGTQAPEGRWDDAVGIVFQGQYVGCTGTLVAPDVVLTAEHCTDGGISHVLIGSKNWVADGGEIIAVDGVHRWPGGWTAPDGYDIAVLTLAEPSSYPHRRIATECIIDNYLADGVDVHVVGFGVTRADGGGWNSLLNEGLTEVQTADCDADYINGIFTGCKPALRPGGEIGAGGNGVDACFGDSGGPLYLPTPEGTFLVGVTSRAYLGVNQQYPCRDGGIYVRPDAVIDWLEEKAGRTLPTYNCNQPPEVQAGTIEVTAGDHSSTWLQVIDDSPGWQAVVVEAPEHGEAWVVDDEIVYVADEGYEGEDSFVVAVTDERLARYPRSRPRTVEVTVPVLVSKPRFLGFGCSQAAAPATAGWLVALLGLVGLRRRS